MGDNTARNIGLPMLIVVLVSLCLFSFGGIAYSTARQSLEKSEGLKDRAESYYGACNEAEETLAGLSSVPEEETSYSFPFGTSMEELRVTIKPDGKGSFDITGWVTSDSSSWVAPSESTGGPQPPGAAAGGPQPPDAEAGGPQPPVQ